MADTTIPGATQLVAPYEANLVAQAEQKRVAIAKPALQVLARLRASINKIDYQLAYYASALAVARDEEAPVEWRAYAPDMTGRYYWMGAFLLLALELSLNMGAIEQLRMRPVHAWATAGFISLVNFFAAKTTARVARQRTWQADHGVGLGLAVVANGVILLALYELAQLRAADALGSASRSTSEVLQVTGDLAGSGTIGISAAAHAPGSWLAFWSLQVGGYVAVLLLTFFQLDPCREREQLAKRITRLERKLRALWAHRETLAARHNEVHAGTTAALDDVAADNSERVFQYRDGNMRARHPAPPPAFFAQAIDASVFKPIDLGKMVDPHPAPISDIVNPRQQEK